VSVCVATTDDGLWVTADDGGLAGVADHHGRSAEMTVIASACPC